jgi:Mitochondrial carrier protein
MSSQNMFGDDTIASSTTSFTPNKAEEARSTSNSGFKPGETAKNEGGKAHYQNESPPVGPDSVKNDIRGDYDCFQYNSSGDSICKDLSNRSFPFSRNISEYFSHPSFEKYKQEYSKNAFLRQVIASSLGTCVSVLTLNPISVLKLRLQRQDAFAETSVRGAFRTIYRKDGIRGFWAGEELFCLVCFI